MRRIYASSALYASSVTGSSHSLEQSSPGKPKARWLNQQPALAPCQCLTFAGISTMSPGTRLWAGLPSSWYQPALNADKNLAATLRGVVDMPLWNGRLDVELLDRTGGSCVFTSDGMRLRQRAEEMLSLVKQSEMGLADRELGIMGGIRIGAGKRRHCDDAVAFQHVLAWADRVL